MLYTLLKPLLYPIYRCSTKLKQIRCLYRRQDVQIYCTEPNKELYVINEEITDALLLGKPVVALESTVISHGLPYPENLRTAQELEKIVRNNGATPATIAIFDGKIHIGLTLKQMEYLSKEKDTVKVSRRDIAAVLSKGLTGATTVSATMVAAHKVGISVFVTGGIGGVHRQGHITLDISTDLTELGRTPVAVVSAGIKSILDISRTLEYLETQGVTVVTLGSSHSGDHFPAFFSPCSKFQSPYNVSTPLEAAKIIDKSCQLGLQNGLLIAVPIPENQSGIGEEIEKASQKALQDAENRGISGKEVTPYVLKKVNEITRGKSLERNILLLKNNSLVGSQIAKELSEINIARKKKKTIFKNKSETFKSKSVTVIGGTVVDFIARLSTDAKKYGFTNPGNVTKSFGGVAKNIADCLSRLGVISTFLTAVGDDQHADDVISSLHHMDVRVHRKPGGRTATYNATLKNNGELLIGVGDMDINNEITPHFLSQHVDDITQSKLICIDGNIPMGTMDYIFALCSEHHIPVWFEPTSIQKAIKPFSSSNIKAITVTSPNYAELQSINNVFGRQKSVKMDGTSSDLSKMPLDLIIEDCLRLSSPLLQHICCIVVTLGQHGVLVCQDKKSNDEPLLSSLNGLKESDGLVSAIHYPSLPNPVQSDICFNVSGAGDCFAAGMICGVMNGFEAKNSVLLGLYAAQQSLMSFHAVPPSLRWPVQFGRNDWDLLIQGWHPRIIV